MKAEGETNESKGSFRLRIAKERGQQRSSDG